MITVDFKPTVERYKKQIMHEPVSIVIIVIDLIADVYFFMRMVGAINIWRDTGNGTLFLIRAALFAALVWSTINIFRSPKLLYNQHTALSPDIVYTVSFSDDIIISEEHGSSIDTHHEYSYGDISTAIFDKGWFILRMGDAKHQFVFPSEEITSGNEMELKALLSGKLGNKFRMKG